MASYYNKEKFEREDEHMKVAVIVNELTVRGGTHKQVLRLCQYLEKKEIDFVLCTKYYDPDTLILNSQNIILYIFRFST